MKKKLLKRLALTVIGVVMVSGLVGCSSGRTRDNASSAERQGNTVVVGFDNTFVPMGFLDKNNNVVGFDVDLAKEALKRAGYKPKFENIDWSMKEQALENGNVDCLWNGYSITPEREKKVAFSIPYFNNKQIVITKADEPFKKISDLKNQPVGTQTASSAYDAIENDKKFLDIIKDQQPITYDTYDKALRDLEIGRIKAVVGDEVLLKYYIKQRDPKLYKILEGNLGSEKYGVGFRKDDNELREKVDKALQEMMKDGTFKQIEDKWFNN